MEPRCKKCGRPLRDPESIARGMGPACAGVSDKRGKSVRVRKQINSGSAYSVAGTSRAAAPMFAWVDNESERKCVPDQLGGFPPDLLNLVLSAPATGAIATHLKRTRRKRPEQKGYSPGKTLKEIRRRCIDLRMLFWPGFSLRGQPMACIPSGDNNWRIGQDGREIGTSDLISYLSRYGMI